jgi:hypothetical protein
MNGRRHGREHGIAALEPKLSHGRAVDAAAMPG